MKRKKYVKICPKCKSLSIKNKFNPQIALGSPTEYGCEGCGFTAVIFPEIEIENKEEIEEKIEELKKEEAKTEEKKVKKRGRPKKISEEIKKVEEPAPAPTAD